MRGVFTRLGFTVDAARVIVDDQGIDDIQEMTILSDLEVENLCKVVRRPGGVIPNPNAAEGQPQVIPNQGSQVSLRAENNLKLACFWLRHRVRTSRETTPPNVTLASVRTVRELRLSEQSYDTPHESPTINDRDWPRTIEALEEYFRNYLGETKIPLAYVIRKDRNVPADPDPSANYSTVQAEMIRRAPQVNAAGEELPTYASDNRKVWELLSSICREHECWTYIKPAQRSQDGRRAFLALFNHYLGPNNVDNMASAAERKLETTAYNGEKKRWNFERYVRTQVDQHSILEGLVEHGYAGIDERSKVRHLTNGIKTDKLDSVKTQIMASAALRVDFDACVNLFKDFIAQTQSDSNATLNISSVSQSRGSKRPGGGNRGGGGGTTERVEDRYYSKAEYEKLTPGQKHALKLKREARGHKGTGKRQKLASQVAAASTNDNTNPTERESNGDGDGDRPRVTTNRNHSALTRQPA